MTATYIINGVEFTGQEIARKVGVIREMDFGDCNREMHYLAQRAINEINEQGRYVTAVNMLRSLVQIDPVAI